MYNTVATRHGEAFLKKEERLALPHCSNAAGILHTPRVTAAKTFFPLMYKAKFNWLMSNTVVTTSTYSSWLNEGGTVSAFLPLSR